MKTYNLSASNGRKMKNRISNRSEESLANIATKLFFWTGMGNTRPQSLPKKQYWIGIALFPE